MKIIVFFGASALVLLLSGCTFNGAQPKPVHKVVYKNSVGKSKILVEYMKKHNIHAGNTNTRAYVQKKTLDSKKKMIKVIRTIKISDALKKIGEKDGNTYALHSEISDFSFPYQGTMKDMTIQQLSKDLKTVMGLKIVIVENKDNAIQPKIVTILDLNHHSEILKKRNTRVSATKKVFCPEIPLNKPMTLKKFFYIFGKIQHRTYVLDENENIPMNKNVKIHSVSELSKYLRETKGFSLVEHKEKYFSEIEIKH